LNGQIDTDASDRGHGMGCIAYTQQTRPIPLPQAICPDGQQFHIAPVAQLCHAVAQERGDFHNARTEVFDSCRLHSFGRSFGNRKTAMPVVSAVDGHEGLAAIGVEKQLRITRVRGQPCLQRIHGSANVFDRQPGAIWDTF
jgi:hypothetical protein